MRLKKRNLTLLVALTFSGCAHHGVNQSQDIKSELLGSSEVRSDIDELKVVLKRAYSGRRFLPDHQFDSLLRGLDSINLSQSVRTLCEEIAGEFKNVSDNHLKAKLQRATCLPDPKKIELIGENEAKHSPVNWLVKGISRSEGNASLIAIKGFPNAESPAWNGFIEAVNTQVAVSDFVIIDLRGNGGGDDHWGFELSNILAGYRSKTPYSMQWKSITPESFLIQAKLYETLANQSRERGEETKYLDDLKESYLAKARRPHTNSDWESAPWSLNDTDHKPSRNTQKPIYILIDGGCGSSCESTVDAFEYNTSAVTVGQPTAGYIHFGNIGYHVLSRSGITIQIPTTYNEYRDHRFIEKTGIQPKVIVKDGQDAEAMAWQLYRSRLEH